MFGDVFAPVGFFTPFPHQTSRPCGTPHIYHSSRLDVPALLSDMP